MDVGEFDALKKQWKSEQLELKKELVIEDAAEWLRSKVVVAEGDRLHFVGGVDISFVKGDETHACAAVVLLSYPELEVVYEDYNFVHLTAPYIPEFLAFREVSFLQDLILKVKENNPEFLPQVIFVDGNGILHPRGFGLASHLGVITDMCTVGIGKTLFQVDGLEKNSKHLEKINQLKKAGDSFALVGNSGAVLGAALRSTETSTNPIYVSIGHQISLETSLKLTTLCCRHRVPEPVRQADMRSREFLRLRYDNLVKTCCGEEFLKKTVPKFDGPEEVNESWWKWCSLV